MSNNKNTQGAIKLVTVHGTGAGDITSSGDKWWQLGSVFLRELLNRLKLNEEQVEIVPFQWDVGPNSEAKRREAGIELAAQLKDYDTAGQDYYVVGHSHGGSVIYNALLYSVKKNTPFEGLKIWCTVGTPFLDYRPNKFLFQRLKSLGLTLCTSAIVAFLLGLFVTLVDVLGKDFKPLIASMGYAFMLYGMIIYTSLWLFERLKKSWFSPTHKKKVHELYSKKWCGLWHKEDEAISALANVQYLSAPIIPNNFLQPIVASLQFLVVIVIGLYFAIDVLTGGDTIRAIALWFKSDYDEGGIGYLTWMILWAAVFLGIPIVWVLTKSLSFVAWVLGRPLAKVLNKIVWASIQQRAWGDDLQKEDVQAISSHPPEFSHQWDELSENIAAPLREHSENNAIKTLHKVRVVLGMSENAGPSADIRSELSESLNWQELIHTSYFDVPEFIDLLASKLLQAGLSDSSRL